MECLPTFARYPKVPNIKVDIQTEVLSFIHRYQTVVGEVYLETCFEADSFDSYSHQPTRSHASLLEEEVVEVYGRTLIPYLLQNITISLITLE